MPLLILLFLFLGALPARAANLDVTADYKMKALSYSNLNLSSDKSTQFHNSFISNDARLGVAVRKINLETIGGEESTMDVGITLRALGATGSTTTLQSAPFNSVANNYPSVNFTPFLENAYLKITRPVGLPIEATFGRQNYRLGSGLLLDDDGAGFTGVTARAQLPWWGMKLDGFIFSDKNNLQAAPNSLTLFGLSLDLPTEGVWELNELIERDHSIQTIYGCTFPNMDPNVGCQVSKALRSFTSARYSLNYGPMVFDGEAAIEKGVATPTGNTPAPNHITYNANAEVVKAKWKQNLPRLGEGIARFSLAHGSGNNPSTPTTDEAFYPSHGHQFDGLDRSGFGEFFNATPYNAFGGNYTSTSTANGLGNGASGILVVGAGYTPPAYHGIALDVDYFLFQADRVTTGSQSLGSEWDFRLRYNVQSRFGMSLTAAYFKAGQGSATNLNGAKGTKYAFTAFGKF